MVPSKYNCTLNCKSASCDANVLDQKAEGLLQEESYVFVSFKNLTSVILSGILPNQAVKICQLLCMHYFQAFMSATLC